LPAILTLCSYVSKEVSIRLYFSEPKRSPLAKKCLGDAVLSICGDISWSECDMALISLKFIPKLLTRFSKVFPVPNFVKISLGISKAIQCVQADGHILQLLLGIRNKLLGEGFLPIIHFFLYL
jgi:hypothetical protein